MRLGVWNVQGWSLKSNDNSQFRKLVLEYTNCDILALTETFLQKDEKFTFFGNNRKTTSRNANRGSGGVGVLVKNEIYNSYTFDTLDLEFDGILWIKMRSKTDFLSLCIAICYLPPAESCRALDHHVFFQTLLEQVYTYELNVMPDRIPDHSLLYCDILVPKAVSNASYCDHRNTTGLKRKFKVSALPNDFLNNEEITQLINDTISNIENSIQINENIQIAYDQFQSLIRSEMENKLPVYETDYNRNNKHKKSMFKPYWNDILRDQMDKVCVSERKWLKHSGSNSEKRKLKDSYCTERKQFDRMNRKFKRRYQNNERQKLEDKLYSSNQRDFWRSIGKVRICNERKSCIPNAVVNEDGMIETDKVNVLDRWKEDFRQLFNSDENNDETIPHSQESQNVHRDITELNEPITREEVITAVTRAKGRKSYRYR
ncbi:unnamed protein product [Mytilus coruscus]|uniref:Endonuclease/exonuclease/phosphatase domain-containing protein n=1 Tax=Mytilus coruscus TaxID=42192 RepID=A0A6J8C573_MYTCO|nr:unnamed protein product [Mytilus coruscus]